jgi:hypothetical protein
MRNPIKTTLGRHSIKKKTTKTGLSQAGINLARASGRTNLSGKVKGYTSPVTRAKKTLEYKLGAYRAKGGKTYPNIRLKKELDLGKVVRDMGALEKLFEKYGAEEPVLRKWLDGKISSKAMVPAKEVADQIIKKRFGLGQRVARTGTKDRTLENVSHSWFVEAVFERLTGVKFEAMRPGTMVRETEGLTVNHYKNGKAVLRYRGKSFDVTKQLNSILKR